MKLARRVARCENTERVAALYSGIVPAGVHRAASIEIAEAAKVIENTRRDLNIALMNELAIIFDRLGLDTREVLAAAETKWNFLPFRPGLVGGHCIGVDPYYLTHRAGLAGYQPQVILAGRRINDGMAKFIAGKTARLLELGGKAISGATINLLGLTFKENVTDIRNSKVAELRSELVSQGARARERSDRQFRGGEKRIRHRTGRVVRVAAGGCADPRGRAQGLPGAQYRGVSRQARAGRLRGGCQGRARPGRSAPGRLHMLETLGASR